jgi:hypothetical protein
MFEIGDPQQLALPKMFFKIADRSKGFSDQNKMSDLKKCAEGLAKLFGKVWQTFDGARP